MYTSGTESHPKGGHAQQPQPDGNYVSTIVAGGMSEDDIEIHSLPLYHCAQLDNFLATDIYLGATSIILPRPDPEAVLRNIERYGAPITLRRPRCGSACCVRRSSTKWTCPALRKGYYGASGDADRDPGRDPGAIAEADGCGTSTVKPRWRRWHRRSAQTSKTPTPAPPGVRWSMWRPRSSMRTTLPSAVGVVGEIAHRSPHLMLGYLDDEDKTAEAFRGGWFHSGDLGYYDEHGLLHVVDRKKDMIKTGGENVASREVEEVLYRHSGGPRSRGVRACAPGLGRSRGGGGRAPRRRHPHRGRRHLALPGTPRRIQDPQTGLFRRIPAEEPQRQAAQARAAGAVCSRVDESETSPETDSLELPA